MGVRVHKMLGYGLTDLTFEKNDLTDPRINLKSVALGYEGDDDEDREKLDADEAMDEYAAWLKAKYAHLDEKVQRMELIHDEAWPQLDRWFLRDRAAGPRGEANWSKDKLEGYRLGRRERRRDLADCFTYNAEYGLGNVICIQPLGCHDWYRYDDMIDWVEESQLKRQDTDYPQINWVEELPDGIYPFSALFMDNQTGKRLSTNGPIMLWRRLVSHYKKHPEDYDPYCDELARAMGYADHAEALTRITPEVPGEIRDLCEWTKLFVDPKTVLTLKPILYTWWG